AYTQGAKGNRMALPPVLLQFPAFARAQSEENLHRDYWKSRLDSWRSVRFPSDAHPRADEEIGWSKVSISLGEDGTNNLRRWCRAKRTTVSFVGFAAFVSLISRWCDSS